MRDNKLDEILRATVIEYGIERVERALRRLRKSSIDRSNAGSHSGNRTTQETERSKNKSKRPRTTAPAYVSKLEIPDDIKHPLEELARKFDNKVFLPTFGDTKNFCNLYGIDVPLSPSRVSAIPRIFRYLSQLTPNEVQAILQSNTFSGPSRLAPIADAIRRSSEQRAGSDTVIRQSIRSSSEITEKKGEVSSKPRFPSKM